MKSDEFNTLRKITDDPESSQRKLASNLGFSLGKLNYCLNALRVKGLVKLKNFKNNKTKIGYTYLLTPKGISAKKSREPLTSCKQKEARPPPVADFCKTEKSIRKSEKSFDYQHTAL